MVRVLYAAVFMSTVVPKYFCEKESNGASIKKNKRGFIYKTVERCLNVQILFERERDREA